MDELKIKGKWNELKGKLKKRYSNLTDNDLIYEEGYEDQLIGKLEQKTGESREKVIQLLKSL